MVYKETVIIGANNPTIIRLIKDVNRINNSIKIKGFLDSNYSEIGSSYYGIPVLGSLENHSLLPDKCNLINTIASNMIMRKKVNDFFLNQGFEFINIIHPSTNIESVDFGSGNIVYENAMIHPEVKIGSHNIISSCSGVAHNNEIGNYNFVGPAVYICGRAKLEDYIYIGVGAKILPRINIGSHSLIAAGAVVISDVKTKTKVRGIPAKEY